MYRKLLAILMTMCLVAVLFAGCGGKDGDDASNPSASAPSTEEGTVAGAGAALPGQTQSADGEDATGLSGSAGGTAANTQGGSSSGTTKKPSGGGSSSGTTKKNSGGSSSSTTKKPSGGGSSSNTTTKPSGGGSTATEKEKIVSYFNAAANKVKTGRPGLKFQMSMKMSVNLPPPLDSMIEPVEDESNGSVDKGKSLNQAFPVSGKTWASQLPATAVKSATRTLKDGKYTIRIVMSDEKNVTNFGNSAHGKAFTFMDLSDLSSEGMSIKRMVNNFLGSSITCVVDSKTGNMLSATYSLQDDANITISSEGKDIGPLPTHLSLVTNYTMSW